MEAFQVAASALSLCEIILKLYSTSTTFVTKASISDKTIERLYSKTRRLKQILLNVSNTLSARKRHAEAEGAMPEEVQIWSDLEASLKSCEAVLWKFLETVAGFKVPREAKSGLLKRVLTQARLDRIGPVLQSFQDEIDGHITELSVSLECLNGLLSIGNERLIRELKSLVERLPQSNVVAVDIHNRDTEGDLIEGSIGHAKRLGNCIESARKVIAVVEPNNDPSCRSDSLTEKNGWATGQEGVPEDKKETKAANGTAKHAKGNLDPNFEDTTSRELLDDCENGGRTPLIDAFINGDPEEVERLIGLDETLQQPHLNFQDEEGWTALHHAIQTEQPGHAVARTLLLEGANPNIRSLEGKAPLHYAVCWNKPESAELLLERDADVNIKDKQERTPLVLALQYGGCYRFVKLFLDHGADIEPDKFPPQLDMDVERLLKRRSSSISSAIPDASP